MVLVYSTSILFWSWHRSARRPPPRCLRPPSPRPHRRRRWRRAPARRRRGAGEGLNLPTWSVEWEKPKGTSHENGWTLGLPPFMETSIWSWSVKYVFLFKIPMVEVHLGVNKLEDLMIEWIERHRNSWLTRAIEQWICPFFMLYTPILCWIVLTR